MCELRPILRKHSLYAHERDGMRCAKDRPLSSHDKHVLVLHTLWRSELDVSGCLFMPQ